MVYGLELISDCRAIDASKIKRVLIAHQEKKKIPD